MTSQHTPGPWNTKTMRDGSRNVVADHDFICQFSNLGGTERDKQEANGRLIAAAPELLEALVSFPGFLCGTAAGDAWIEKMHAAIAKATRSQS